MTCIDCQCDATNGYDNNAGRRCADCHEQHLRRVLRQQRADVIEHRQYHPQMKPLTKPSAFLAVLLLLAAPAFGDGPQPTLLLSAYQAYDSDTLTDCVISFGWGLEWHDQTIRLANFDGPEITRTRQTVRVTDAEIVRGKKARDAFAGWLAGGVVAVRPQGKAVYGRLSADVLRYRAGKWEDAAEFLKTNGHAR